MSRTKLVLAAIIALIVVAGIGYAMGGSGRFTLQTALDESRERLGFPMKQ